MNLVLTAFVIGAAGFYLLPMLPDACWLCAVLLLPLLWHFRRWRWLAGLSGGLLWSLLHASYHLAAVLPPPLEGRDLVLTGSIGSIPVPQGPITRFEMRVASLEPAPPGRLPQRVRLNWYDASIALVPGEIWRLKVRLKRPRGLQNPGGFDYERWLFSQGIQATGYVRDWEGNRRLGDAYGGGWLDRQRQRIGAEISRRIEDPQAAALIRALGIGDRSGLSDQAWRTFTRTGTNHLVAISGLHIGMVAGLAFFLGQWLWRRSERLGLLLPAPRAAAWLALAAAVAYAALAGFSLPTQRALIMLGLGLGAMLLGRTLSVGRSLVLALFGVVLIDPLAPLSSGFWLSFGAVAVILFALGGRLGRARGWRAWGRVQWVVALGLAPLLFILFNQASLIAPLVNLLLVPWFSLVLVPVVLAALAGLRLPLPFDLLMGLSEWLARQTLVFLDWAATAPFALVHRPDLSPGLWVVGILGILLLLSPRGLPGRRLGLLLLAPMLFNMPQTPRPGEAWFTLLDVGQGLACVVETAEHVMVYDTGPAYASGFNSAEAVLIPYLRSRGHHRIDRLIVSNADRDHAGGVESLLGEMEVARIMAGESLHPIATEACVAGAAWTWDGVAFRILHPRRGEGFTRANDASCVVQVDAPGGKLLLTGDVEREGERLLVERYGDDLHADILVAPHHGSNTSSTQAFVDRVRPDFVLFPTGYRNRFGFPKAPVMTRWRESGSTLYNSAETGAIEFRIAAQRSRLLPTRYRQHNPRSWLSADVED